MRTDLPAGTVTFLFTDVEGSTRLLHSLGAESYADALAEHRGIIRAACTAEGGVEVDTQGDAFFFAFASAEGAVSAAASFTQALSSGPISVRVGLHTGSPLVTDEGYVGDDVHFAARVAATSHGGQIVCSGATAELLAPSDTVSQGIALVSLGTHRLKDIHEPVSIYQLGEGSFPSLKTIANSNLPTPASSFLGREAELYRADALLRETRLLTITGPGGAGKTRFALELARRAREERFADYPDGVFACFLASLREPALVLPTLAQTLSVREQPGHSALEALASHLQGSRLLVLLDNAEHLLACAPELSQLLERASGLTLLVTSRELLRIAGEAPYALPPLPEAEGIALFCERSGLEPSPEIAEICARLEGLPLALELAAARTAILTPQQLLDRLAQRLDLLKAGRDADPRQATLRATIDWSYELLSPEEQRLLRSLSVFQGGCTLEAAEQVAGADLDSLHSLVDKSLLRFGEERFWMLETIREYALQKLEEAGEADAVRERHADYFLELAATAEPELWAQQTDRWLHRLDAEQANFRAALDFAIARTDAESAMRLVGCLYPYWEIRARHEARSWLDRALALDGDVPASARAKALVAAGRAATWQFDLAAGVAPLEEAAKLFREHGDDEGLGRCLGFLGHVRLYTGDSEGAAVVLDDAVELARAKGDRRSLARALSNAAFAAIELGELERARAMFEEAETLARSEGMPAAAALTVILLGYGATLAGDFELAARRLDEGVAMLEELGDTTWTPVAQRYLALLALLRGRLDEAESLLRAGLLERGENAPHFPYWIEDMAAVAGGRSQPLRAATLWGATDALFEEFGLVPLEEGRQVRRLFREPFLESAHADAWARGRAMPLQQALDYALSEDAPAAE
jgi:predicted ATPase/class 3 adenylate cyclase